MDYLITIYGLLFVTGVVGNGILAISFWWGHGSKSPLLMGLVIADFFVCCLSGPLTAVLYSLPNSSTVWLLIAQYVQSLPVSASTLSMMAISVDRYFTVKNYRPIGQAANRKQVLRFAVAVTWLSAAVLASFQVISRYKHSWRKSLMLIRITLMHITPACIVLLSHLGVHAKLTALSLTARAKHGELPLPIPLMRRPTHVIIVAGVPKGYEHMGMSEVLSETIEESGPPTSTLSSRRRLANCLLGLSMLFIACWLPYVVCQLYEEITEEIPPDYVRQLSLFFGHMHSALSPILYWSINHRWPKGPCSSLRLRLSACRRPQAAASSTDEAALGPFNPRLVQPPPNRRRSSLYLY